MEEEKIDMKTTIAVLVVIAFAVIAFLVWSLPSETIEFYSYNSKVQNEIHCQQLASYNNYSTSAFSCDNDGRCLCYLR